jgi:Holliday junction resolvasome RuvABC endonuclease subunit
LYRLWDLGAKTPKETVEESHKRRFHNLYNELTEFIEVHKPDVIAVEELHQQRNLNSVKLLGGLYAITLLVLPEGVGFATCHQGTAKKDIVKPALGIAKLGKEHVFEWAVNKYNLQDFELKTHNDITDSILVADWVMTKLTKK